MSNLLNIKDQSGNWIPIPVVTNGIKSITQNEDYTLTITLNDGTTYTTTSIKGEDGQDYILTEQDKQEIAGLVDTPVDDVRINGQSIVESGVANVPAPLKNIKDDSSNNGGVIEGDVNGDNCNVASGQYAHAEGFHTKATGNFSHTEGFKTEAYNNGSHTEGSQSKALANCAHAEGLATLASGVNSHAEGKGTIANRCSLHVHGEYNAYDTGGAAASDRGTYVEIIGNGTDDNTRSNARTLDWNGNEALAGSLTLGMNTQDETSISANELKKIKETSYVEDVQINGESILNKGIAEIPIANSNNAGVVKVDVYNGHSDGGIVTLDDKLYVIGGIHERIRAGSDLAAPVSAGNQHQSVFYGLAKASGDKTQSQSDNPVGTYTDEAKASIKNMLGVEDVDIDSKAPVITETATGSIVSFDDGADNMPLQSLVVDINPVQDLHGYNSPWVGGGGKNKCAPFEEATSTIQYRAIYVGDGTFTASSTSPWDASNATVFFLAGNVSSGASSSGNGVRPTVPVTQTAVDGYVTIAWRKVGDVDPTNYQTQIESGSTATDYAPYENICPISGWTGANVTRCGKNLFDKTAYENIYTTYDYKDSSYFCKRIQLKPNTEYTVSFTSTGADSTCIILFNNIAHVNEWGFLDLRNASGSKTYTTDDTGCLYIGSVNVDNDKYNDRMSVCEIQIEEGSTATEYEPYQGQTYPIVFPEEAGAIYGGYVDVGKGALNVEWVQYILDGTTQKASNLRQIPIDSDYTKIRGLYYVIIADFENSAPYNGGEYICSHFKWFGYSVRRTAIPDSIFYDSSKRQVCWVSSTFTTLEEFNQYLTDQYNNGTPVTLVYKNGYTTENPIPSVEIRTLLGINNIWSDTGNVSVTYRADSELYIDKQIPDVPVEDVQINGTSILTDGVANLPVGNVNNFGVLKLSSVSGMELYDNKLRIQSADIGIIKNPTAFAGAGYKPIVPRCQHESTFYGLAKAAGDTTQSSSSNAVGEYTSEAKTAIKQMLGVKDDYDSLVVEVSGTDPVITGKASYRYNCGELYTLSITPPESGTMDIIFTSGATPTVLTLPETVKMPDWWAGIETNTTYEMCITDGTYCGVMSWAT